MNPFKKEKMTPEEFGMQLALALVENFVPYMRERALEIKEEASEDEISPNITDSDLYHLFQTYLVMDSTIISVKVESSAISESNKKIILDSFWNSVPDYMNEIYPESWSEKDDSILKEFTSNWYSEIRQILIDPPESMTNTGSIGPGKLFLKIAMPERYLKDNVEIATMLTLDYFISVKTRSVFVEESLKNVKFTKSLIRYE